jgi:hypothetical protein
MQELILWKLLSIVPIYTSSIEEETLGTQLDSLWSQGQVWTIEKIASGSLLGAQP